MKKLLKWLLRIVITLVLLVVIAAFILPLVFDPNDHKDTIEQKIQQQIGRQMRLNGEIEWSVFPWLALTFNDVTIANEKGFKGETLAAIQQLSARVKLLPLLSKNIEIGKVAVDGAEFNLQVTKKGKSNWQGILDHLASDSSTDSGSQTQSSSSLNVAGIKLSNISLNYYDAQSKTRANISKLELNTGKISKGSPVNIDSFMHINMPETGLDLDISVDMIAKNILSDNGMQLTINDFTISGQMKADSRLPIQINLEQPGQIDLAKDSLVLPEILVSAGDAKISTSLAGSNITKNISLSGDYKLASFDLNAFFKNLTGAPVVSTNILEKFSSEGQWSFSGKRLKIAKLNINFAETKIKGSADIKNLDKMSGVFDIQINQLNVDDFLGDDDSSAATTTNDSSSNDVADIDFGHLTGAIKIDSLTASGTKVENMTVQVKTNGSKMSLAPIKADFYKGLLATEVHIDTKATTNKIKVVHKMNKIQAGPLLTDLAGSEMLTGIGDLNIDLNIDEPFSEQPLKTAHGKINYKLGDGAIYGVDVFGMMKKGLSMLYPDLKQNSDDGIKKTDFALMEIDADIEQGILTTNTLKIESPYLQVTGDVVIDLINMTIEGSIEPMLLDVPEELVSDKYKKLLNLPIPVSLSGSLLEPSISIDVKKLLLSSQKERIDKEKDKLKNKLLGSLFGKDKKKSKDENVDNANEEQSEDVKPEEEQEQKPEEPKKKESKEDKLKNKLKDLFGG